MGALGQYLKNAREAKDIDLRDAAQQTRISISYLKALEEEDFAKLPGEVFVRGFLKNYARFLELEQTEALQRYSETTSQAAAQSALKPAAPAPAFAPEATGPEGAANGRRETPLEPFIWGAAICIALLAFLFASLPGKQAKTGGQEYREIEVISGAPQDPVAGTPEKAEKLYLEVIALSDTWLLIRTDASPQKKAVLKKGESLIWSADERFLLSYGQVGDVKLLLNGEEIAVQASGHTPIRDLAITGSGILNQPVAPKPPKPIVPKPKPAVESAQTRTVEPGPVQRRPRTPAPSATPLSVSDSAEPAGAVRDQAAEPNASTPDVSPRPTGENPAQ